MVPIEPGVFTVRRIPIIARLFLALALLAGCAGDRVTQPDEAVVASDQPLQRATQRPFSDYLETQGTFCFSDGEGGCIDFEPPLKNFLGWSDPTNNFGALFEYLGNADRWLQEQSGGEISLGTEISGDVTERLLPDGRALIHLNVRAKNILAWVIDVQDFFLDPLVFGTRVVDVLNGAEPSLGRFTLEAEFTIAEPGAPIPDLFQLYFAPEPGQEVLRIALNMTATGILHEGSGYPAGTRAKVRVMQVYPPLPNSEYLTGWAVEKIDFHPLGPVVRPD